jgi:hypothetical protein
MIGFEVLGVLWKRVVFFELARFGDCGEDLRRRSRIVSGTKKTWDSRLRT